METTRGMVRANKNDMGSLYFSRAAPCWVARLVRGVGSSWMFHFFGHPLLVRFEGTCFGFPLIFSVLGYVLLVFRVLCPFRQCHAFGGSESAAGSFGFLPSVVLFPPFSGPASVLWWSYFPFVGLFLSSWQFCFPLWWCLAFPSGGRSLFRWFRVTRLPSLPVLLSLLLVLLPLLLVPVPLWSVPVPLVLALVVLCCWVALGFPFDRFSQQNPHATCAGSLGKHAGHAFSSTESARWVCLVFGDPQKTKSPFKE